MPVFCILGRSYFVPQNREQETLGLNPRGISFRMLKAGL